MSFEKVFQDALADLKADAKSAGLSMDEVCRRAGVARATPVRWVSKSPNTVQIMSKMQDVIKQASADK